MRADLSMMFENMPSDFARALLYTDPAAVRSAANPYWSLLQGYSTAYKKAQASADPFDFFCFV